MSKIDKYIENRSKRDADFAKAVEKDKENLLQNRHPSKMQYRAL